VNDDNGEDDDDATVPTHIRRRRWRSERRSRDRWYFDTGTDRRPTPSRAWWSTRNSPGSPREPWSVRLPDIVHRSSQLKLLANYVCRLYCHVSGVTWRKWRECPRKYAKSADIPSVNSYQLETVLHKTMSLGYEMSQEKITSQSLYDTQLSNYTNPQSSLPHIVTLTTRNTNPHFHKRYTHSPPIE